MERPNSRASMRKEVNGRPKKQTSRTTHGYSGNFLSSTYATTLFNKAYSFCDPYFGVLGPNNFSNPPPPPYSDLLRKPYGSPYNSPYHQPMYPEPSSPYSMHSAEPSSLPNYGPWSSPRHMRPTPMANPNWDVWSPNLPLTGFKDRSKPQASRLNNGYLWTPDDDEFASLPPQVNDEKSPRQSPRSDNRRFSDPGLNIPVEDEAKEGSSKSSFGEDDEEEASAALAMQGSLMQRLLMEMGALRAANQNLRRELNETKVQLETVKAHQNSSWRKLGPDYHPGMFADMVQEVREASRMRDEAMLSRLRMASTGLQDFNDLRAFLESQSNHRERPRRETPPSPRPQAAPRRRSHRASRRSLNGSRAESSIDEDESSLSGDLLSTNAETASCSSLPGNSHVAGVLAEQVSQLQRDKQQLNEDLKVARESRTETEAHVQKLERLVSILRKKVTNINGLGGSAGDGLSFQGSTASSSPSSSLEPVLTGALSQVTIHGPVTNL